MMKWISCLAFFLINFTLNIAMAAAPVTLSGPSPTIAGNYNPGESTTVIYTITNNVPKHSFPIAVSGISSPLARVTVANDCGNRLAAALPTGPSTCQLGINISPQTQDTGTQINQVLFIDYQARSPLKSAIQFAVSANRSTSLINVSGAAGFGGTATLTATLINAMSTGIAGATVSFALDGTPVGTAITNANGIATLSGVATSDPVGTDSGGVNASFAGNSNYLASMGTGDLIISQASTTIQNVSGAASFGGTATLTATLVNTVTSTGIVGATVSFTLDATAVGSAITNANGIATLTGVPTTDPVGTDPGGVTASFAGNSNYSASMGTGDLIVALMLNDENSIVCNSTLEESIPCFIDKSENQKQIQTTKMIPDSEITNSVSTDAILKPSVKILALSVKNTALNKALSGNPRQITIVNSSNTTAYNVKINASDLPTGTIISSDNCATLPANTTCTLTITPGTIPSTTIYVPAPQTKASTLTISGDNTNTLIEQIYVLTYGSVYQSGFVFSVDDTTAAIASVGGKVAALIDQASPADGVRWGDDSESASSESSSVATTQEGSPESLISSSCNGHLDGKCNTHKIVAYYGQYGLPRTAATYYAAALCQLTIAEYSDWYLPAICEMGYDSGDLLNAGCGTLDSPILQNIQSNLVEYSNLAGFATTGGYWSSTQVSHDPQYKAWYQLFVTGGSSYQNFDAKNYGLGVRCIRALTQ